MGEWFKRKFSPPLKRALIILAVATIVLAEIFFAEVLSKAPHRAELIKAFFGIQVFFGLVVIGILLAHQTIMLLCRLSRMGAKQAPKAGNFRVMTIKPVPSLNWKLGLAWRVVEDEIAKKVQLKWHLRLDEGFKALVLKIGPWFFYAFAAVEAEEIPIELRKAGS